MSSDLEGDVASSAKTLFRECGDLWNSSYEGVPLSQFPPPISLGFTEEIEQEFAEAEPKTQCKVPNLNLLAACFFECLLARMGHVSQVGGEIAQCLESARGTQLIEMGSRSMVESMCHVVVLTGSSPKERVRHTLTCLASNSQKTQHAFDAALRLSNGESPLSGKQIQEDRELSKKAKAFCRIKKWAPNLPVTGPEHNANTLTSKTMSILGCKGNTADTLFRAGSFAIHGENVSTFRFLETNEGVVLQRRDQPFSKANLWLALVPALYAFAISLQQLDRFLGSEHRDQTEEILQHYLSFCTMGKQRT